MYSMSETEYFNVADIFGENVFNDAVMQERLPKKTYKKLRGKRIRSRDSRRSGT
mgnify:CR=1 FL=1